MAKNFSRIYSAQPYQLQGHIVSVEIDITHGLHAFSIVGLPDKAVEEARDRVGSAIKNSGYSSPKQENQKTVVSLAPAELRKEGSYFDCAIAIGYLLANHSIEFDPDKKLFIGELSLNGELQPVYGILPIVQAAKKHGFTELFVSRKNAAEAALVDGITIYPADTLHQVIDHINETSDDQTLLIPQPKTIVTLSEDEEITHDFKTIIGQETAKRGLEIAAAGGHNILMSGPPGTGKTMLARAFADILPPLSSDAMLEVTGIHSIAGLLKSDHSFLISRPPFRAPHHTSSYVSLVGGGSSPKPGEVTLAHLGVLFLDEFPEFDKKVIESLRQPMEDRIVTISRAKGTAVFPAQFMLVATMNPCPCGNFGSQHKVCICNPHEMNRYRKKLSGPIMDRIDLWMNVEHVDYEKLVQYTNTNESSDVIQKRIFAARTIQQKRFGDTIKLNAFMTASDVRTIYLSDDVQEILKESSAFWKLSPRSYHRIIKLARTIADLDTSEHIQVHHVLEAFQYRPRQ